MEEAAALGAAAQLVRPGGGVAVITQGPPLCLGAAPWQQLVRAVLEQILGPVSSTCGSDADALQERRAVLAGLGLEVQVGTWRAQHRVEVDWVVGHLGSALADGALGQGDPNGLAARLRAALAGEGDLVEEVTTTAVIARATA